MPPPPPPSLFASSGQYLRHFEGKLHSYIERECDSSVEDFYDQCHAVLDDLDLYHPKRFFIEALLATTEYQIFFSLMVGEVRKLHPDYKPDEDQNDEEELEGEGRDEVDHAVEGKDDS